MDSSPPPTSLLSSGRLLHADVRTGPKGQRRGRKEFCLRLPFLFFSFLPFLRPLSFFAPALFSLFLFFLSPFFFSLSRVETSSESLFFFFFFSLSSSALLRLSLSGVETGLSHFFSLFLSSSALLQLSLSIISPTHVRVDLAGVGLCSSGHRDEGGCSRR